MKKLFVFTLVAIMLIVSVVPAFAAGGPPANRAAGNHPQGSGERASFGIQRPYALSGVISALDSQAGTITVTIACGNQVVKPYLNQDVTLQTSSATRFLLRNPDGTAIPISFGDLEVGQYISSHGTLIDGTWVASRITSGALLTCLG